MVLVFKFDYHLYKSGNLRILLYCNVNVFFIFYLHVMSAEVCFVGSHPLLVLCKNELI